MKIIITLILFLSFKPVFPQLQGLVITGNPESVNGATWTYQNTVNGVTYNLQGILLKPIGRGPFPAVIINHGTGGNAAGYSRTIAKTMVTWGYVCIATNYTHSGGVACGSPGLCIQSEFGASQNNILRGMKCHHILTSLSYVDTNHVMSFGHSRGAFLTTALVGTNPQRFSGAAHTAGGVSPVPGFSAPDTAVANNITVPYLMHHGDIDSTVFLYMDTLLQSILQRNSITNKLKIYHGYEHNDVRFDEAMYKATKAFFEKYCLRTSKSVFRNSDQSLAGNLFDQSGPQFNLPEGKIKIELYNILGQKLQVGNALKDIEVFRSKLPNGIYFLRLYSHDKITFRKLLQLKY